MVDRLPLVDLAAQEATIAGEVLAAIAEVARDGRFVLGPRVEAFERWLADACAAGCAVGVASGTDALELALRGLGIGAGDAVITPSFSFAAAAEAICWAGATPVFCDVDPSTWNVDAACAAEALRFARRAGLRVRAILPVHLFGRAAPMAELIDWARAEGLLVVEDAAQALGARDARGRPVGAEGHAACFSFFPTKTLGAWGDGGAVVTSDEALASRLRRLRVHGAREAYVHDELGRNSRLDALQAAVLLVKSRHHVAWREARTRVAERYRAGLAGLPVACPEPVSPPAVHAWHAFVIRLSSRGSGGRDGLARWLAERDIETRVYYPVPLHHQAAYAKHEGATLPATEEACRTVLALPIHAAMTREAQDRVIAEVGHFLER